MNKQYNYKNILKEAMILTLAVGIITAAVYFFLVPSHTSVSSISGCGEGSFHVLTGRWGIRNALPAIRWSPWNLP